MKIIASARGASSIVASRPEFGVVVVIFNCFLAVIVFKGGKTIHGEFLGLNLIILGLNLTFQLAPESTHRLTWQSKLFV